VNAFLSWLSWKLLFSRKALFGGSVPLALLGLVLGVAALVVSMAVMSGFESTLRQAMADAAGSAQVVKRSRFQDNWTELEDKIRSAEPKLVSSSRFVYVEAVMAHQGKISGVLLQGVDVQRVDQVLNFKTRVTQGDADLKKPTDTPLALIGKGLAAQMGLSPGDKFRVVVPIADASDSSSFQRKVGEFKVEGILDLGKSDWNERFVIADLTATQQLAAIGDRYTGLLLKFDDLKYAREAAFHLSQVLGSPYWVRDWRESNENLFEAVEVERPIIFFVVLIIVFVACFNVSSTLFVSVVQRNADIAVLKTMGVSPKSIRRMFSFQGLFIGAMGILGGIVVGLILCALFTWAQAHLGLVPGSVYRLDNIQIEIRFVDLFSITVATLAICFLATMAPAIRGSRLSPVEGLRYE
jgi:lipoprotein-releasing system permease protein